MDTAVRFDERGPKAGEVAGRIVKSLAGHDPRFARPVEHQRLLDLLGFSGIVPAKRLQGDIAGGQGVRRANEKSATCVYIIRHSPNMVQRPFVELDIRTDAVLFPKAAARLKEG